MSAPQIVWLRRDLRLADHAAFQAAAEAGPVIPVFVLDDESPGAFAYGGASRWWLHHALSDLMAQLEAIGARLILRRGRASDVLAALARETKAGAVHALHHYEPWWRSEEAALAAHLPLKLHDGNYLMPPGMVRSGTGTPYKIFTPFYRALMQHMPPAPPQAAPRALPCPEAWPQSETLADWKLLPARPNWAETIAEAWEPNAAGLEKLLAALPAKLRAYENARNLPSEDGTSRLAPFLHFGMLSPAQLWAAIAEAKGQGADEFRRQLVWRDYAGNVITQFPDYASASYRAEFAQLRWRDPQRDHDAARDLEAWRQGRTGYPIIDAGMRQLWREGWMHGRVRMLTASFLIKHLLIDWRIGAAWFHDTLLDADLANNAANWQWVAGSGVDANMFVRIMAPLSQSAKFEAARYIRRYVPELSGLPDSAVHEPDPLTASANGYPAPLIEHRAARERALAAYAEMKAAAPR